MNIDLFIEYVMRTPHNANINVMYSMLSEIDINIQEKIIKYVLTTPGNSNRAVLKSMFDYEPSPIGKVDDAKVGYAVVG